MSYYHRDEQLSTAYITGGQGEIQNSYLYDAFGTEVETNELFPNCIRYTGQQYDELTEQYYLRARYYNPVLGRFMQEDVYQGDGLNLYAYCRNNPVVYYDPSGYDSGNAGEFEDGLGTGDTGDAGDVKVHTPSSNTTVNMEPEKIAPNAIPSVDAMDEWDNFLGLETTNINPRTGLPDSDRIFSADGTRSIRFGPHEMNSIGTTKAHFHYETWTYDDKNDVMIITNLLQRMK